MTFGGCTVQEAALLEVRVLRDDGEASVLREAPDFVIFCFAQTDVAHMKTVW